MSIHEVGIMGLLPDDIFLLNEMKIRNGRLPKKHEIFVPRNDMIQDMQKKNRKEKSL